MKKVLSRKTVNDVTYKNEYEALNVLSELLFKIIETDFKNEPALREYILKRVAGAREVLRRVSEDYITEKELRSVVLSSKAEKGGVVREITMKTLDGRRVVVKIGVPDEEAWYSVKVSRYRFKCTCQDAVLLTSIADRRLKAALLSIGVERFPTAEPVFPRYVLCKHTIAKIAKAMAAGEFGVINVDKEFVDTLKLGLFAVYLREVEKTDPEVVRKMYSILEPRLR